MAKVIGNFEGLDDGVEKVSVRFSMDTCSSMAGECQSESQNIYSPGQNKFLFHTPLENTSEYYEQLYSSIERISELLVEEKIKFCIRDDFSMQPKAVLLRSPQKRRNTNQC
jgi:hypothetical protein